jgi:DOPA 4,5-dioxygenase
MTAGGAPFHAHIYYPADERPPPKRCARTSCGNPGEGDPEILFVGQMTEHGVGPIRCPQYEVHFLERRCQW